MAVLGLALQGGGSHGAFTWGVLDRLLDEVDRGELQIGGLSGASAGAINAALCVAGLAQGGPAAARAKLRAFWEGMSQRGASAGNALFGFLDPGLFGFNIDWSPGAIALEALGLVVSPYTNLFYRDYLGPLLRDSFSAAELVALNAARAPRVFVSALNVGTGELQIFSQPDITLDSLRASACLPTEFKAVQIGGAFYWDGGYTANPALDPLLDVADDLLLVVVNPLLYENPPPITARQILDRLNQVTFNASLLQEVNAIEAVNKMLRAYGRPPGDHYRPIRLHMVRNERFAESLGFVSKSSTSWALLDPLFHTGRSAAGTWVKKHLQQVGRESSFDLKSDAIGRVLKP